MKRRQFIAGLGSAAAWPVVARAQQPGVPVIGFLGAGVRNDNGRALPGFHQGLREVGFIEGQNVAIEFRAAENQNDRLPALAAELVRRRVAVIVVSPTPQSIAAVKAATTIIPIVFVSGPDPVTNGFVASLNRPGGNLTGFTLLAPDLTAKRLGLMHDLAPQVKAVALLLQTINSAAQAFELKEAEPAGRTVGLRIIPVWAGSEGEFDGAFATAIREGAGALMVAPRILFFNYRDQLVALAARHKLPAIYQTREYAAAGGLMSYGPSLTDAYRQAGIYVGRILKGEKPADLPVLQPTKFELVLNFKTAKALGLTIPETLLATADEVIQ